MALPVIADVFRCVFHWSNTLTSDEVVSVQHFRNGDSAAALAADLDASFVTNMLLAQPDGTDVVSVDITALDGVSGAVTFPMTTWTGEGGAAEPIPGLNVLVLGSTGLRGSANRGRIFLPACRESIIDDGLLNAGGQFSIEEAWNDFLTTLVAAGTEWGVASYVTPDFDAYISVSVPRMLGIIKRRRRV